MKPICHFCTEPHNDENIHTCHRCRVDYCFREDCAKVHEIRCADLMARYETIYEISRGRFSLHVEPREWYDEVREGNPFRCLNCEKTLWIDSLEPMSKLMSLSGANFFKHLFCSRAAFQESTEDGYPFMRGFCRHCDSLLELKRWQAIVQYQAAHRRFWRTLGDKKRFEVRIYVSGGR